MVVSTTTSGRWAQRPLAGSRISRAPLEIVVSALGKEAPLWGSLLMASREARRQLRLRMREARIAV